MGSVLRFFGGVSILLGLFAIAPALLSDRPLLVLAGLAPYAIPSLIGGMLLWAAGECLDTLASMDKWARDQTNALEGMLSLLKAQQAANKSARAELPDPTETPALKDR